MVSTKTASDTPVDINIVSKSRVERMPNLAGSISVVRSQPFRSERRNGQGKAL
jgi:hypothetical protein